MRAIDSEQMSISCGSMLSRIIAIFLGLFGIMQADFGLAADINFDIGLSEIYTSNLFLLPEELEVSDFVTRISPGVDVNHEGNGLEAHIGYSYEALFYADNSDFNEDFHQLDSDALVDLIGEELQLAGEAIYTQINIDPTRPQTTSNISLTGNRANAFLWTIGPDWQRKLPLNSEIDAAYRYGQVDYDDPETQDVDSQRFNLELASDRDAGASTTYSLKYAYWSLDYETSGEIKDQRVTFTLRQEINQNFGLLGLVGSESDIRDPRDGSLSESWWEVGSDYSDGGLNLAATVGERYFGRTFRLSAVQQLSSWQFTASYSEEPGTSESFNLAEVPKDIGEDPIPEPPPPGLDEPGSAATFIRKRADGQIGWQGHRSGVNFWVWWDERKNLPASVDDPDPPSSAESIGVALGSSWQAGSRLANCWEY
jgi:uncharacterized protein (PEP-CTERM system associated)